MTRDDIRRAFPEATEAQIDQLLNIHSADIGRARGNATQLQADLQQAQSDLAAARQENAQLQATAGTVQQLQQQVQQYQQAEQQRQQAEQQRQQAKFATTIPSHEYRRRPRGSRKSTASIGGACQSRIRA